MNSYLHSLALLDCFIRSTSSAEELNKWEIIFDRLLEMPLDEICQALDVDIDIDNNLDGDEYCLMNCP
ncbi:MAG: hypothetical protein HC920_13595 [Oscillatoriales cyanobacterium SM2_3_0]|nr:hypothetical protein [Oscillatoriales cyanobacterium SM2_3_0]